MPPNGRRLVHAAKFARMGQIIGYAEATNPRRVRALGCQNVVLQPESSTKFVDKKLWRNGVPTIR